MIHTEIILIPKSRIPVLIGEKGASKNAIQKEGDVRLHIDSETGKVLIKSKDALRLWQATHVVKAIARGFPPEVARKLFKEGYTYEQMSIEDFAKTKKDAIRLRGRLIGKKGTARDRLQQLTQTQIRVQGKTVAILGESLAVDLARRAIDLLLSGKPHQKVYGFVQEQKSDII